MSEGKGAESGLESSVSGAGAEPGAEQQHVSGAGAVEKAHHVPGAGAEPGVVEQQQQQQPQQQQQHVSSGGEKVLLHQQEQQQQQHQPRQEQQQQTEPATVAAEQQQPVPGAQQEKQEEKQQAKEQEQHVPGPMATSSATALARDIVYVPSLNFSMVAPGVYRSGYPNRRNFAFLHRLGLRSIVYLCPEEYADASQQFMKLYNIRLFQYKIQGNKEPFVDIPEDKIREALAAVLDVRNHPLLIHCNKGKHRTGCLVGCLRKVQRWSLASIFDEYRRYAGTKVRLLDQQFIELFDPTTVRYDRAHRPTWL